MPMSEEARQRKNAYNREYRKRIEDNRKRYTFTMRPEDNKIIQWLDSKDNLTGYLRNLVLADMEKNDQQ